MQKQMDFEDEQTPLQNKLNTIVEWIGKIGIISAALVFLALVLRIVFDIWAFGERDLSDEQNLTDVTQAFIVAVTVVVMAVPEGLPLAVTISLQFSISDLQNTYNALVRKPDATEVMGGCNEICSDKTGTLTANKMTVMACWVEQGFYDEYDAAKEGIGKQHGVVAQLGSMKDVADAILINSADTKYTEVEDEKTKEKSM
jgi:Ca2+ transporting ATPase